MRSVAFRHDADVLRAAEAAAEVRAASGTILIPTETFYGLAADPSDSVAVGRIAEAKGRPPEMAVPVLVADWQQLESLVLVPERYRVRLSRIWPAALTVILRTHAEVAAGREGTLAVRIPGHAMLRALLYRIGPLTGTSANRHGRPPTMSVADALASLANPPDLVLDGGPTSGGLPSTLVDLTADEPHVLRRGEVPWRDDFPWDDPLATG